jgi:Iap family predicted aminopeptidase
MTMIKDISMALSLFVEAATKHAEATKEGDYKTGNKNYDKAMKAFSYLKEQDSVDELLPYLNHDVVGVRLAAATCLLPKYEKKGVEVLEAISKSSDFFSFIAETTLSEWRKGNLKL